MARVLSTLINLHTFAPTSVLGNEVASWGWADAPDVQQRKYELYETGAHRLRRFPEGRLIAQRISEGRRYFRPGPVGRIRAHLWVAGKAMTSTVVLHDPQLKADDNSMYWLVFAISILTGRKRYLYSERWYDGMDRGANIKRRVFLLFAHVLVPGTPQLRYYRELGVPPRRLGQIPSIYCPAAAAQRPKQLPNRFIFIGRAIPLKGLDRYLSALSRLPEIPGLVVLGSEDGQFTGSDPNFRDNCVAQAAALPNVNVVHNLGEVETVMTAGAVLVVPNRVIEQDPVSRESWGRVVEEALFAGIPVIATDCVPSALTLVKDGVNGRVIPHDDEDALLAAMRDALAGRLTSDQPAGA